MRPSFLFQEITEAVLRFAAEQKISKKQVLQVGLEEKAKEFAEKVEKFTPRRTVCLAHPSGAVSDISPKQMTQMDFNKAVA